MDQTRVTSGYDVEVAMGGRCLQYLLLMAVETGQFPIEETFTPVSGGDAIRAEVLVPFGRLQAEGILRIAKYELVEIGTAERFYYRDRYVREEEPTTAARLADNLHSQPRYRNTPTGRVFA